MSDTDIERSSATDPPGIPWPGATVSGRIDIDGDTVSISSLQFRDPYVARLFEEHPDHLRVAFAADALRVGVVVLGRADVAAQVDYIEKEFQRFATGTEKLSHEAEATIAALLREHFADKQGKLPRTLEQYLGDSGKMAAMLSRLADPDSRSSLVGRIDSKLSALLDPTREHGPLHPLYQEVRRIGEQMKANEAGSEAGRQEREKGTAKGGDFEDALEPVLGSLASSLGDAVERTSRTPGHAGTLTGDFTLTLNPDFTAGLDTKVAVEAKDAKFELAKVSRELAEARRNRGAAVAVAVYAPGKLPDGFGPLTVHGSDIFCEFDPEGADWEPVTWAVRVARLIALNAGRRAGVEVDAGAVRERLSMIERQLQVIRSVKTKLTSIGRCATEIAADLSEMRTAVEVLLGEVEAELRVVEPAA